MEGSWSRLNHSLSTNRRPRLPYSFMNIETPPNPVRKNSPWNEVIGLLLIFTGFVMSLALLSYHSDDPSWASTGGYVRAKNWAGPIGAHIASALYQALGLAGWLVPMVFFTMGWWQWRDIRTER